MSTTPFKRKRFPKITVFFEKQVGMSAIDVFGNPIIQITKIPVICYLEQTGLNSSPEDGMTLNQINLEGYCVSPKQLPPGVAPGAIGQTKLTLNVAGSPNRPVEGSFRLSTDAEYSLGLEPRIAKRLGQRIKGVFTYQTVWGETVDVGI